MCSNFIGAAKQAVIDLPIFGPTPFGAGILFFPISYFFGGILTEVYGYARDRRVVWAGFVALAFASLMACDRRASSAGSVGNYMKTYQPATRGGVRRCLADRGCVDARILVRQLREQPSCSRSLKLLDERSHCCGRSTIGSTIVGEAVDSSLFYVIAFYGIWETSDIVKVALIAVRAQDHLGSAVDAADLCDSSTS